MLAAIVRFSVRFRGVVIALAALLMIYGGYALSHAGLDIFPEFSPKQVIVQTESPGLSAEQVESLVTQKIENALGGLIGLASIRSESIEGLSVVTAIFEEETDIYRNRQQVSERLAGLIEELPEGVAAPVAVPLSSSSATVLTIGLSSESRSLMDLRSLVDWTLAPRLLAVPGVADVNVFGGEIRQLQIQLKPEALRRYGVGFEEVIQAAGQASAMAGVGFVENANQRIALQVTGFPAEPEQLRKVVLKRGTAGNVTLGDVADVTYAARPPIGAAAILGKPGIVMMVIGQYGANTLSVSRAVEKRLEEFNPLFAKQDITFYPHLFRPADYIETSVANLTGHLLVGGLFVIVVLYAFLFNFRTAFICALVIPLSLISAAVMLLETGTNLNIMVLGGLAIALGEVVDDAIIDTENIFRRLGENRRSESPLPTGLIVYRASMEVRGSVVYASFIVALVFVPLLTLDGVAGRLFSPLGYSYILAILASLGVALTLTPSLCYVLLDRGSLMFTALGVPLEYDNAKRLNVPSPRPNHSAQSLCGAASGAFACKSAILPICPRGRGRLKCRFATFTIEDGTPPLIRLIRPAYERLLNLVARHAKSFILGGVLFCLFVASAVTRLGGEFLPELREGHFIVHTSSIPGTSLQESLRIGGRLTRAFLEIPGVQSVSQWAGRAQRGADTFGSHYSEYEVRLDPLSGAGQQRVLENLRDILGSFPGILFEANTFLTERVDETISGYTSPVVVNLYGNQLDELDIKAHEVAAVMRAIEGAADVQLRSPAGTPLLLIRLDLEKIAGWGLRPLQVMNAVQAAYESKVIGKTPQGNRVYDVAVALSPELREQPESVGKLPIRTPDGALITLDQVADILQTGGRYNILHRGMQRLQTVTCNVAGRDLLSFMDELRTRILREVKFPADLYPEFTGAAVEQAHAREKLLLHSLLAGAGVLILIYIALGSLRHTLLTLVNLPFALAGGVCAVLLTGATLSVGSMVGFVTLFGITVRNSIMLISHCRHLVEVEGKAWNLQTAIQGAGERLPSILMTALVTALAMLPIAFDSDNAGREIMGPMATIIIGGLASSTLLNLLLLPAILLHFGRFEPPDRKAAQDAFR